MDVLQAGCNGLDAADRDALTPDNVVLDVVDPVLFLVGNNVPRQRRESKDDPLGDVGGFV